MHLKFSIILSGDFNAFIIDLLFPNYTVKTGGIKVTPWCHSDGCSDNTLV